MHILLGLALPFGAILFARRPRQGIGILNALFHQNVEYCRARVRVLGPGSGHFGE
ncbi:MAG: hypothetical protein M3495_07460 [Pseudomonadota bacterium]|nr:hypothetical protein [Pseudomonadota bacterium]